MDHLPINYLVKFNHIDFVNNYIIKFINKNLIKEMITITFLISFDEYNNYIEKNPTEKLSSVKKARKLPSVLSFQEIENLIQTHSPYLQDRQFIMERLASNKESQTAFANALQRNSEVMNELKIQLAMLSKTLESIEDRIEKSN